MFTGARAELRAPVCLTLGPLLWKKPSCSDDVAGTQLRDLSILRCRFGVR